MSKKSTNKRVAVKATIPQRSAPKVQAEKHEHTFPLVKTRGRKVRYGCPCGYWDPKWKSMTENELNVHGNINHDASDPKETGVEKHDDNLADARNKLAGLLGGSQAALSKDAQKTADQAGVKVVEGPAFGDTPAMRRTGISDTEAAKANTEGGMQGWWRDAPRNTSNLKEDQCPRHWDHGPHEYTVRMQQGKTEQRWCAGNGPLTDTEANIAASKRLYERSQETVAVLSDKAARNSQSVCDNCVRDVDECRCGDMASFRNESDLPDRNDHSDTAVQEDFEPEFLADPNADICYLILGDEEPSFYTRTTAHNVLENFREAYPEAKHEIGDALWDDDYSTWRVPNWTPEDIDDEDDGTDTSEDNCRWICDGDQIVVVADEDFSGQFMAMVSRSDGGTFTHGHCEYNAEEDDWFVPESDLIKLGFAKNKHDIGYHKATVQDVADEMSRTLDLIDQVVDTIDVDAKREEVKERALADVVSKYGTHFHHDGRMTIQVPINGVGTRLVVTGDHDSLIEQLSKRKKVELHTAVVALGLYDRHVRNNRHTNARFATWVVEHLIQRDTSEETIEEQAKNPDRFYIELNWPTDEKSVYSIPEVDMPGWTEVLDKSYNRDYLEYALRQMDVAGVTTKTVKWNLVRAIVCMADTTIPLEHRKNRAHIMVRTGKLVDPGTEFNSHYGDLFRSASK